MARKAKGTLLQIGDGQAIEVFTTVAELINIGFPEFGTGTIETTHFDSTAEEFVSDGIQSHGEFEAEVNWLPDHATQNESAGALKKALDGAPTNWKISVPLTAGTKVFSFAAFVKVVPSAAGVRDALKARIRFRPTGAITIT